MELDVLNPRRAPRVAVRCHAQLRHRLSSWSAETEDLGPAGCQLVTSRLLPPGRELSVRLHAAGLARPVSLAARVVWVRPEAPARLGVAFAEGAAAGWFDALLAADPAAARLLARTPDRLPWSARLFLGAPPQLVADFGPDEEAVLRAAAAGLTVEALAGAMGARFDRARGALFSLVSRRTVVLERTSSVPPHRWRHVLGDVAVARPAARGADGPRGTSAQALYDEGLAHLSAGRVDLAVRRFREALAQAPGDEAIAGLVRRLAPWSG